MRGLLINPPPFFSKIAKACTLGHPLVKIASLGNADAAEQQAHVDLEGFGYFSRSVAKLAEYFCAEIPDLPGKTQAATALFLAQCPTQGTKVAALANDDETYKDLTNKLAGTLLVDLTLAKAAQSTDDKEQEKLASLFVVNAQYAMELLRNVL